MRGIYFILAFIFYTHSYTFVYVCIRSENLILLDLSTFWDNFQNLCGCLEMLGTYATLRYSYAIDTDRYVIDMLERHEIC